METEIMTKPQLDDLAGEATALERRAAAIVVADVGSLSAATALLGDVAQASKTVEARRVSFVKPLNEHVKWINSLFKRITEPLDRVDLALREKILAYRKRVTAEAEAERRKAEAERVKAEAIKKAAEVAQRKADAQAKIAALDAELGGDAGVAERSAVVAAVATQTAQDAAWAVTKADHAILAAVPPPRIVTAGGHQAMARKRWVFEVKDARAVPREFLVVDEKAIRKAVAAGVREIPGVVVFEQEELAVG